ncbi:hypothetical protein GUA87_10565 [Sneathiella sp. P13V-1]|uniref:type II secretion system F family protein n=1 Tax=Sneathiella sp. P13V-1 TaxID=2697366 RepID=UPI00187B41F3|nr:type II secretion system F family protein [Sneathiella sp. P13V-1]MBE7637288.1 hypothetical protein [Sneathiella sp. P13V-1]
MSNEVIVIVIAVLILSAIFCLFVSFKETAKEKRRFLFERAGARRGETEFDAISRFIVGFGVGTSEPKFLLNKNSLSEEREEWDRGDNIANQYFGTFHIHRKLHSALNIGIKVGTSVALFCIIFALLSGFNLHDTDIRSVLVSAGLSVSFGILGPEYAMKAHLKKIIHVIEQDAPDVIDLLMLGVEAGLSFDQSVEMARHHIKSYSPKIGKELETLSAELVMLPDRTQALENLAWRTGSETFRYLKVALIQGEHYGTPIASSLKTVAKENRERLLSDKEERARRVPVFLSIPLMLLILPPVIVISAGPGFISMMRVLGGGQ